MVWLRGRIPLNDSILQYKFSNEAVKAAEDHYMVVNNVLGC